MNKETQSLLKVAAPVVFTNNLVTLTQSSVNKRIKTSNSSQHLSPEANKKNRELKRKFFKTISFFLLYEGINRGLKKLKLSTRKTFIARTMSVFLLQKQLNAFSWGVSIYIFLRGLFQRGSVKTEDWAKMTKNFLLNKKTLLAHTNYIAYKAKFMAPNYLKIWISVLPEYYKKREGGNSGVSRFHKHFHETNSNYYEKELVDEERFSTLPKRFFVSFKQQITIFFGLYMLSFFVSSKGLVLTANKMAKEMNLDKTQYYKLLVNTFYAKFAKVVKDTIRSSLCLTFLAHNVTEFPVVYAQFVKMKKKLTAKKYDSSKVESAKITNLVFSAALCVPTLLMEVPGRTAVLVSYLYWRIGESFIREHFFELDERTNTQGNEKFGEYLAAGLIASTTALSYL
eukprot:snap_masked-scaffold_9-processed-gene-7.28-mRNA-1 protein AED:1.00 eAED:1.00 QI:0/0/0/0/1/1/2/0/396